MLRYPYNHNKAPTIVGLVANLALLAFMVFTIWLVGEWGWEDEQHQRDVYCSMVKTEAWPDYAKRYELECKDVEK